MQITISPFAANHDTRLAVDGDILTIDGTPCDLSAIPEGGEATDSATDSLFEGVIRRINGQIICKVRCAYDMVTALSDQSTDWADYAFEVVSGPVPDPIRRKPIEEPATADPIEGEQV